VKIILVRLKEKIGGEVTLNIDFLDKSEMSFRFGLDGQRFTSRQSFYYGNSGEKEVFLQPCHFRLKDYFRERGFKVLDCGRDIEEDFGNRIKKSFSGQPLERISFLQNPDKGIDSVVIQSNQGELRFVYDHGFLIAIEDIPSKGEKTIYEVGEKGSHYRGVNLMVAGALAQENDPESPLESLGKVLAEDQEVGLIPVTEEDLVIERKNKGKIIHLGARIK